MTDVPENLNAASARIPVSAPTTRMQPTQEDVRVRGVKLENPFEVVVGFANFLFCLVSLQVSRTRL